MSAINEVLNFFRLDFEKKNVGILMDGIFPHDGVVVDHGKVKGEIGSLGWRVKPEVWWNIECNETNRCYHIRFKVVETAIGDIYYFWNGEGHQNFTYITNENNLRKGVDEFLQSGNLEYLEQY